MVLLSKFSSEESGGKTASISASDGPKIDGVKLYQCAFCGAMAKKKSVSALIPIFLASFMPATASTQPLVL
jgi:hypothetical protein